jgi:hypothetical protein
MLTIRRRSLTALAALVLPALLSAQGGRGGGGGEPPKNLQVLPKESSRQDVLGVMRTFTAGLGVECAFCHAPAAGAENAAPAGGGPPLDFASDSKDQKKTARAMLQMVNDINGKYLPLMGRTIGNRNRVSCETCHHGLNKPQTLRAALANAVDAKGADSAVALYRDLRSRYYGAAAYDFSERSLPAAADELARANQRPAALSLLRLNLEFYAQSAATYQSIAQLSLQGGDTASALDALKKAVALQPNNPQLQQMLQRLGGKSPSELMHGIRQ